MAKLVKILAASVGGGLVLGAGIRLGEAIATWQPPSEAASKDKLSERLRTVESRLQQLEAGNSILSYAAEATLPSNDATGLNAQGEPSLMDWAGRGPGDQAVPPSPNLREELRAWIDENVSTRMADMEVRLRVDNERGQQQVLHAFTEGVQTKVLKRITELESEVAGQAAAVHELRECSLRTEQSVQKLLSGLDRLIARQDTATTARPPEQDATTGSTPAADQSVAAASSPSPKEHSENPPRRSGWKIFG